MLKPLFLTPEKRHILMSKMIISFLWIPDEIRTEEGINDLIDYLFYGQKPVFYEIGNFGGIIGFYDILPEYKCTFLSRLWNRTLWTHGLVREIKDMVWQFKRDYKIKRISLATPDERLVKFAKILGFRVEGTQRYGFRFDGKLYTQYLLRIV